MTTLEAQPMLPTQDIELRYEFMLQAVRHLGALAWKHIRAGNIEMYLKPDGTKVTTADIALNEEFIAIVESQFPRDLVWGEECSNSTKNDVEQAEQDWLWVIDPIDGTSGFWRDYSARHFSDSTATILVTGFAPGQTTPTMAVIANPFNDNPSMLTTVNGQVWHHTPTLDEPKLIRLTHTSESPRTLENVNRYEQNWWKGASPDLRKLAQLAPNGRRVRHQLFMGAVALGDSDISAFPGPSHPHDIAPGAAIVHHAGGTVLTLKGEKFEDVDWRLDPINGVVAASNATLARELVDALAA